MKFEARSKKGEDSKIFGVPSVENGLFIVSDVPNGVGSVVLNEVEIVGLEDSIKEQIIAGKEFEESKIITGDGNFSGIRRFIDCRASFEVYLLGRSGPLISDTLELKETRPAVSGQDRKLQLEFLVPR